MAPLPDRKPAPVVIARLSRQDAGSCSRTSRGWTHISRLSRAAACVGQGGPLMRAPIAQSSSAGAWPMALSRAASRRCSRMNSAAALRWPQSSSSMSDLCSRQRRAAA